jgi:hypothetical protein
MTKLKLPLAQIKTFLELSSKLEQTSNEYLSTGEYIKLEIVMGDCLMTKNSISSFIEYSFSTDIVDDIEFLVNEDDLRDFCGTINSQFLFLLVDEYEFGVSKELFKELQISDTEKMNDSKKMNYSMKSVRIENFPCTKYRTDLDKVTLDEQILSSINIASNCVSRDNIMVWMTCVYLGSYNEGLKEGNEVFSSDGQGVYYERTFSKKFIPIAISLPECKVINSFKKIDYFVAETHNIYFISGTNIVYGFRHIENTKGFKHDHFKTSSKKENYINIKVEEILLFCQRAKLSSNKKKDISLTSTCTINEGIAEFVYDEKKDVKKCIVSCVGEFSSFNLNHNQMYDVLKTLPYSSINISDDQYFLGITSDEDENYFGFFTKIVK